MKKLMIAVSCLCFAFACNEPAQQNSSSVDTSLPATPTDTDTRKIENELADTSELQDTIQAKDSITHIKVNKKLVWVRGDIKPGQHPSFTFHIDNKDSIVATVKPSQQNGNVRIAQIEMPDKSMDGPFGNELHYKTKGDGMYRIILSQNMMAGDPYTGGYILSVEVK